MFNYLKLLIDKNAPEALHNFCALGSFFIVSFVVLLLTGALLMDKKVGVEFTFSLTTLAGYSGYLVKKAKDTEDAKPVEK